MLSIHQLARVGADYLVSRLPEGGGRKPEAEVVAFGLEVALGGVLQLAVFVIAARYLGLVPEMMAALATMASYRLLSGGVHASAYYRCLLLSLMTLILLALLGRGLALVAGGYLPALALGAFVTNLDIARRLVPVTTPAAPISNHRRRARLKQVAYLWLTGWLLVIIAGFYLEWPRGILASSLLALAVQGLALTPAGFAAVGWADSLLQRILPLG
ncbi:accessory gene regulator ArgB-like protein [Neomoorella thermoacetica]|uniref:accessory gene regulator ArgB-like protein n=1 Tax=Neomoorella thermoacetica TaxID=1525 RepID=UPI0008FAA5FF|nr:accessory gene regulator B family protein [Moorella thermoacetica]OIQ11268.1 putative AgrB-like protein [Moorella thermoacetica]